MKTPIDIRELFPEEPVDAGCSVSFAGLHEYVESELAGGEPALRHPGLAAHLRNCPACREDYLGLLDAVRRFGDVAP
jgi:predicted anti-sigma-YlaC factor YlaD